MSLQIHSAFEEPISEFSASCCSRMITELKSEIGRACELGPGPLSPPNAKFPDEPTGAQPSGALYFTDAIFSDLVPLNG